MLSGLYFDFIAELHTDVLALPPKIVLYDHGVQKTKLCLKSKHNFEVLLFSIYFLTLGT